MNRVEFLAELEQRLSGIPEEERQAAIQYYADYLADAGEENEAEAIRELGSPEKVAESIKADYFGTEFDESRFDHKDYMEKYGQSNGYILYRTRVNGRYDETQLAENYVARKVAYLRQLELVDPLYRHRKRRTSRAGIVFRQISGDLFADNDLRAVLKDQDVAGLFPLDAQRKQRTEVIGVTQGFPFPGAHACRADFDAEDRQWAELRVFGKIGAERFLALDVDIIRHEDELAPLGSLIAAVEKDAFSGMGAHKTSRRRLLRQIEKIGRHERIILLKFSVAVFNYV